jgi:O-antigen ligase
MDPLNSSDESTTETSEYLRESPRRFEAFSFKCALVLIFLRFSALAEIISSLTKMDFYLYAIFGPLVFLGVITSGGIRRTFREKPSKFWLWFLLWMIAAVPFSSWRGGALTFVSGYVKVVFIMLLATAGLAKTWRDCRKIIYTIAAAAVFNVACSFFFQSGDGRLGFGGVVTTMGNPNDLAAHLLLALAFPTFIVLKPQSRLFLRVLLGGTIGLGIFQLLRTASRGALVALVLTSLLLFIRGSTRQKATVGAVIAATSILAMTFLPAATWQRLTSFSKEKGASEEALESSEERQYLLAQSVIYTLQHPIFGVGPGQFPLYEGTHMRTHGSHGAFLGTHNSYTQISSECGIPALIFYFGAVISTFGLLSRIRNMPVGPDRAEIRTAAQCMTIGLFSYSVAITFVNFGYAYEFIAVSGLVLAIRSVVANESVTSLDDALTTQTAPDGSDMEAVESLGSN